MLVDTRRHQLLLLGKKEPIAALKMIAILVIEFEI
jgi:hypothetical protein